MTERTEADRKSRSRKETEKTLDFFCDCLKSNDLALAYLEKRGLSEERIEERLIGFCPPYYEYRFPLLRGRLIVPIRDVHGSIVAFAGRLFEPLKDVTERALRSSFSYDPMNAERRIASWNRGKWINEPYPKKLHLFNLDRAISQARTRDYVVIVEGYLDALTLHSRGVKNVAAACCTYLTERHAALLSRYCGHVVLMLDGDEAGIKAQDAMSDRLRAAGIEPHRVLLDADPDEIVLRIGGKVMRRGLDRACDKKYEDPPVAIFIKKKGREDDGSK